MDKSKSSPEPRINVPKAIELLWRHGCLEYKLWEQQKPIYNGVRSLPPGASEAVFLCARQFGKSYLGDILAVEDCIRFPDSCILIVGPTLKQTVGIVTPRLRDIARDAPPGLIVPQKSESKWIIGSSELVIGGMDINSSGQRGKTLQNVYVEEIVDSDPDKYLESLRSDIGPALTHSKGGRIVFLTTPPKVPDHPFLLETVPSAQLNNAFYKYTIHDNKKITKEQYDRCVKLAGGEASVDFRREYLCEVVRDGSLVLVPEFDEALHVRECLRPRHSHAWISGDMGGTRDRHVFHLMCYDFERNKVLVLDEREFGPDTGTANIVPHLVAMEDGQGVKARHVDAPGQTQVDLMQYHGYPVALPRKDELEATVNQVRRAFQCAEVEVHPRCRLLIVTLRSGTFNRNRTDLERTRALGHCDAFMSMAYGLRHANKANPFPKYGDAQPHTHYIDVEDKRLSKSAQSIKNVFAVR